MFCNTFVSQVDRKKLKVWKREEIIHEVHGTAGEKRIYNECGGTGYY